MSDQCKDMDDREREVRMQIEMLAHTHTREQELEMQVDMLKAAWQNNSRDTYAQYFWLTFGNHRGIIMRTPVVQTSVAIRLRTPATAAAGRAVHIITNLGSGA